MKRNDYLEAMKDIVYHQPDTGIVSMVCEAKGVSTTLRALRESQGLSAEQVAADFDIAAKTLRRRELKNPWRVKVMQYAAYLGYRVDVLIYEESHITAQAVPLAQIFNWIEHRRTSATINMTQFQLSERVYGPGAHVRYSYQARGRNDILVKHIADIVVLLGCDCLFAFVMGGYKKHVYSQVSSQGAASWVNPPI
jgi:transcriptional regulator with XRE-family HTH domain